MKKRLFLIRYGELALKGRNRHVFENQLVKNLQEIFYDLEDIEVLKAYGRLYVASPDESSDEVTDRLKRVFGIHSFSIAIKTGYELEEIQKMACHVVEEHIQSKQGEGTQTFKVETHRPYKSYPMHSMEISKVIGATIMTSTGLKVDVHDPDLTLFIEVRQEGVFLYSDAIMGEGGLPVGSSGKVMVMLSGGIDSPVAGWLAMKRGATLEAVHFQSFPFTSEQAQKKVQDLTQVLTRYGGRIKLHMVSFTEIQTAIRQFCPEPLSITVMRRMMVRITEKIAVRQGALAIVTGESLGQVASQTLESMSVINQVTKLPVLRPLIASDKQEIIEIAKNIGTYETSVLPYEDCCTIFTPKSPKTKPKVQETERAESRLEVETLISKAVETATEEWYLPRREKREFHYF